jgi:hypothetical protein
LLQQTGLTCSIQRFCDRDVSTDALLFLDQTCMGG